LSLDNVDIVEYDLVFVLINLLVILLDFLHNHKQVLQFAHIDDKFIQLHCMTNASYEFVDTEEEKVHHVFVIREIC
jgi:hypothetical protein